MLQEMKHPLLLFFLSALFLAGCSIKNPAHDESIVPVLSALSVADTLFLGSVPGNSISVRVDDPQGLGDVRRVSCSVLSNHPVSVLELLDDGNNGDIIPKDGVFFGRLAAASFGSAPGKYRIVVIAEDMSGNASDSLDARVVVVLGRLNSRPSLSNPVAPDTVKTDSAGSVFFSVLVEDPDGAGDIRSAYLYFQPAWVSSLNDPVYMRDDGTGGDLRPGDGVFSVQADLQNAAKAAGPYLVRFEAQDAKGAKSRALVVKSTVTGVNGPPVLSDLTAPETVSRQSSLPILLSVRAEDPQGLTDVKRVYFNTTKPDGTPSSGNPFLMSDDGANGDKIKGDGVYSLEIFVTPQNTLGVYRFEFFGEDLSGVLSQSIVRLIDVVDAN
jgi:hypothetical protein